MNNDAQQNKLISKLGVLLIDDSEPKHKIKDDKQESKTKHTSSSTTADCNAFPKSSTDNSIIPHFSHNYQPYSQNAFPQIYTPGIYYNYYMPNDSIGYYPTYHVNYIQQPSPHYFSMPVPSKENAKRKKDSIKARESFKKIICEYDTNSFVDYLCTSKGCSYMQTFLPELTIDEVDFIINLIGKKLSIVMTDNYANYFFQKLINNFIPRQRTHVLNLIKKDFIYIAKNSSGTHSLQTLLEQIDNKEQIELIQAYVVDNFVELCTVSKLNLIIIK